MVRNYQRKTSRASWSEESMKMAMDAVKSQEMSLRKAAKSFDVPKDALHRRLQNKLKNLNEENMHTKSLGAFKTILNETQEEELVKYIKQMDSRFFGLAINEVRAIVYEYVEKNAISHNFKKEIKLAGRDFFYGFLKRHPEISMRKPEPTSLNRVLAINQEQIGEYFSNLKHILETEKLGPGQIYNCDESGLTCVHKPIKVLSTKGKHTVASVTSGEKGRTTTILIAINAAGNYVPPMMIFCRKRLKPELIDHAPTGTIGGCSDNGWITTELFQTYIKHFIKETRCSPTNKVLLIFDGHSSHTKSIELVNLARANGLILLSLPPHTSHKLQPLDKSFFKPLKTAFNTACGRWMRDHPGRRICQEQLGELFSEAYYKAATAQNAMSGFSATGIWPFNAEIIPDKDYVQLGDPNDASTGTMENKENELPGKTDPVNTSKETSFTDIIPLPELQATKKRRAESSQIITSSPYKKKLEADKKAKEAKKPENRKSTKNKMKNKSAKLKKTGPKSKPVLGDEKNEDAECFVCGLWWHDAIPGENWIKCVRCLFWAHEACSWKGADGQICDLC